MSPTPRRLALPITGVREDREGRAFGDGMALCGHGRAWISPRKECG